MFQSAPGDQAGGDGGRAVCRWQEEVSIRSRRSGREEPCWSILQVVPWMSFNPLPAIRPGGTKCHKENFGRRNVSIRSRRSGREEPEARAGRTPGGEFQSAPGDQAGRNDSPFAGLLFVTSFNPLPA